MKQMVLMAVALMACAAQAVMTSWSKATYHEITGLSADFDVRAGESGTIAIIADMTGRATANGNSNSPGNGSVLSFGDGSQYVRVSTWGGEWHASFENKTVDATVKHPTVKAGKTVIGISMVRNEGNFSTLEVSVNGELIFSLNQPTTGFGAFWMHKYAVGQNMAGGSQDHDIFTDTGDIRLFLSDAYMTPEEIAALPEPTALALLAFGVAALTLRRKTRG